MATAAVNQQVKTSNNTLVSTIQTGVVAGLFAGGIFGVMMAGMEMMPMIAAMIGSESVVIGFILHMLISAFIGGSYAMIAARLPRALTVQVAAGLVYGIIWWVLGALIIMPLVLGMNEMVLQVGDMQLMSLIGHAIFGLTTAVVFVLLLGQSE